MSIPKFLICKNKTSKTYILHTEKPKFLALVDKPNKDGSIDINPVATYDTLGTDAMLIAKLMRKLGDWYSKEISSF